MTHTFQFRMFVLVFLEMMNEWDVMWELHTKKWPQKNKQKQKRKNDFHTGWRLYKFLDFPFCEIICLSVGHTHTHGESDYHLEIILLLFLRGGEEEKPALFLNKREII